MVLDVARENHYDIPFLHGQSDLKENSHFIRSSIMTREVGFIRYRDWKCVSERHTYLGFTFHCFILLTRSILWELLSHKMHKNVPRI